MDIELCAGLHNFNVKFYSKNQVFGHKKSEKRTGIFLNTDFGREKNPLTWNRIVNSAA
jgi:hypothetical protein